ncbi:hypothetical protein VTN96DRAFT_1193 [Rasamsonia emersonii]
MVCQVWSRLEAALEWIAAGGNRRPSGRIRGVHGGCQTSEITEKSTSARGLTGQRPPPMRINYEATME